MSSMFSIGGLASGLDTNSIVAQLVALERQPIGRLEVRKAVEKREIEAFGQITTKLSAVRTAVDALDRAADFAKFRTATSSNEAVATITAGSGAQPMTIGFTVLQLAQTHQTRDSQAYASGSSLYGDGTLTVTIDGTDHDVDTTGKTLSEVYAAVRDLDGVSASIVGLTDGDHLVITADASGAGGAFAVTFEGSDSRFTGAVTQGQDAIIDLDGNAGTTTDQATSASNTFTGFLQNSSVTVKSLGSTSVTVSNDVKAAADAVEALVKSVNDVMDLTKDLSKFSGVEGEANGPLLGNSTVRDLVNQLRSAISSPVANLVNTYVTGGSVGISLNRNGGVELDRTALESALNSDFEAVVKLFARGGVSSDSRVSYVSASDSTKAGDYGVRITQAAVAATVQATGSYDNSGNDNFVDYQIDVDGVAHTLYLNLDKNDGDLPAYDPNNPTGRVQVETSGAIVQAFQDFLDDKFGEGRFTVEDLDGNLGDTKVTLKITDSQFTSTVTVTETSAEADLLSIEGTASGQSVVGEFGEDTDGDSIIDTWTAGTASGQFLTSVGTDSEDLKVKVTATQSQVVGAGGTLDLGQVDYVAGLAGAVGDVLRRFEGVTGRLEAEKTNRQFTIDLYDDRIEALERRIELRELALRRQFTAMETALSTMQNQLSAFLSQLGSLNASLNQR